jgi:hypothetical protein
MEDEQGEEGGIERKTADYWRLIFVIICGALIIGTIVVAVVRKLLE